MLDIKCNCCNNYNNCYMLCRVKVALFGYRKSYVKLHLEENS